MTFKKKTSKLIMLISAISIATILVAAGCSHSDSSSSTPTTGTSAQTTATTQATAAATQDYSYQEIFDLHQEGFDRSHPFQSLDSFCVEHEAPSEALIATDDGITATEITFVHLRQKLEQLKAIGFAADVGDPSEMFNVFAQIVNEQCGGVYGRQINMELVEVDAFTASGDIDALRNAACLQATEDRDGVFVLNSTGFQGSAAICLADRSIFISTQGHSAEDIASAEGSLVSLSPTLEESLGYLAQYVIDTGAAEGKTVAIVTPDTSVHLGVSENFRDTLEDAGIDVGLFEVIGCGGGNQCTEGVAESVTRLIDEGIDIIFPTLNVTSLPGYIGEMATQGIEPGDVQFYNSNFNSQAGDLVSSKIVSFGGATAGAIYDGATIVDTVRTGAFRTPGFVETQFNRMCADAYESISGVTWNFADADENSPYGMVATVCLEMRIALRALYDAGPNPTRADLLEATTKLGAVDLNNMLPGSIAPGKLSVPDAIHTMRFSFPCSQEGTGTDTNTCILAQANDRWSFVN